MRTLPSVDEAALVAAAQQGDTQAFNRLVLQYQDPIYNLCLRMMGSREPAEDAAQDAFISAHRNMGKLRGANFKSWLFRIASNACLDQLRLRKRRQTLPLDPLEFGEPAAVEPVDPGPDPETAILSAAMAATLRDAINELPPDHRLALVLCDIQGLSYQEIAEVTRANLGTVKSRINRARSGLRVSLREQHGELLSAKYRLKSDGKDDE